MFNEKYLVEDYIIEKLQEEGWVLIHVNALERESYEESLFISALNNLKRCGERV